MSRRLLPLAFVLGLFAAACAEPPDAHIGFGSGQQFVPQVADAQDDVGLYPSVAVDAQGVPYVSYFGFPEQLAEGEVAVPRPIGAPSVPSVLLTNVNDGIWTRGAVAMEKAIPNVNVAFGPAEVPEVKSMKPQNVNGTSVAIDGSGGIHVAWVSNTGVWYAHSMDGTSFMASQVEKARIDQRGPIGQPSIAVDAQGTPWIAYTRTTARGQDVVVATSGGSSWTTEVVATIPLQAGGSQPARTAVAATSGSRPVVLFADGSGVSAATHDTENAWTQRSVESGVDGAGVAVATDADGTMHASYYAGDQIHTATSKDGTSWQTASVADVGTGQNLDGRSTGIGVDDQGTTYVTWYDPSTDDVRLASGDGSDFSAIQTDGTTAGELPTLAVGTDGQVYLAWYDETEQNLMLGAYGDVQGLEFAVQSPTPTGGAAEPTASPSGGTEQCTSAQNGELTVTAEGLAFDTSCIEIPAGEKVTIHFDNKDAGTPHNIAVYPSDQELTNPMFQGEVVTGPKTVDYTVGPFDAGEFYFHCDVHPTMNGTFKVVSGGGGATGGGGAGGGGQAGGDGGAVTTTVTASGLAFDVSEIDLAAGKETKLTFDNQDAGTPHNIAIYPSESQISPDAALFQGEIVTGPDTIDYTIPALDPGTYYFHCDVHPTMNGSVVVG
jgi:plastocyanin